MSTFKDDAIAAIKQQNLNALKAAFQYQDADVNAAIDPRSVISFLWSKDMLFMSYHVHENLATWEAVDTIWLLASTNGAPEMMQYLLDQAEKQGIQDQVNH